jgi:hypothetical protein
MNMSFITWMQACVFITGDYSAIQFGFTALHGFETLIHLD